MHGFGPYFDSPTAIAKLVTDQPDAESYKVQARLSTAAAGGEQDAILKLICLRKVRCPARHTYVFQLYQ